MTIDGAIERQLAFYRKGNAGCLFAAHAARSPGRYGWKLSVAGVDVAEIEGLIRAAINEPDLSTQSLLFPAVDTSSALAELLDALQACSLFFLEKAPGPENQVCLGFRLKVGELVSWVTGFGPFAFLPKTRQAPITEVTFRIKPRPRYRMVLKEAPESVIHLADMNMLGMRKEKFKALWDGSFGRAEEILGEKPDIRSAAKTTFAIPAELWPRGR